MISNLETPTLRLSVDHVADQYQIQTRFFNENEKGYIIQEDKQNYFQRDQTDFGAVRVSLPDKTFCYFRIMSALEEMGITPMQVAITTIGNQVIDYFYIRPEERELLEQNEFTSLLQDYMVSEIVN